MNLQREPTVTEHLTRLLNGLTDIRQAFVVSSSDLEVLAAQGPEESPSSQIAMLIRRCLQERRRVLVLDAIMEPSLGRAKVPFRSALCVLLPGGKRVLYLDAEKAGHFDVRSAEKIESYVQKSRRWVEKKVEAPRADEPVGKRNLKPWLGVLGVLAGLLLLWALLGQPEPAPRPEAAPVESQSPAPTDGSQTTPRAAADDLLFKLRTRNLAAAYSALSPQMGLSREEFDREVAAWSDDDKKRYDLHQRVTQSETDATVLITGPAGSLEWHWTFTWDGTNWKLKRADGGPVAVPSSP